MKINEFDKHGRVKLHGDEYVLVGIEDPGRFILGVRVGEACNADGFYPARWLIVDTNDKKSIVGVAEASDYRMYFNPSTEEMDLVQV